MSATAKSAARRNVRCQFTFAFPQAVDYFKGNRSVLIANAFCPSVKISTGLVSLSPNLPSALK
jgi:hypothetical protein